MFQTFSPKLQPASTVVALTDGNSEPAAPTIIWNNDRYVVAWFDKGASPKAIYAATAREDGTVLAGPKAITNPGAFRSRYPHVHPLGDRILVLYSDDRDGNDGYELYSSTVNNDLAPLTSEQRLTFAARDSLFPIGAFGNDGMMGLLFRDDRQGAQHVFFMRLGCATGG